MCYDMHTHSQFTTDSSMTLDGAFETALETGLAGIAFTEHLDIDYKYHEDEYFIRYDEYFKTLRECQANLEGKLELVRGVEVGIQPHVIEETLAQIKDLPYDYILGSTHLIHRRDPYREGYFDGLTKKEAYEEYLGVILENIQSFRMFDVLAHFDYIVRNAPYPDPQLTYKEFPDHMDAILKFLAEDGHGLEVNTSTYSIVPLDTDILKRYKELGGEIVTIGSDAHVKENVARLFPEHLEIIKSCGFPYVAHYKNRRPSFDKIL